MAAGLTQEELAARSGLAVRTIREMERGRSARPYQRSVRALADALSLTVAQRDELISLARGNPGGVRARPPSPSQLPAGVAGFVGRESELAVLDDLLARAREATAAGTVVISAIEGMAGAGKTALAVHWARRAATHFPDGQIYLNLRGFGPSGTPMPAAEAVGELLDALGVAPERRPPGTDAQAALYRSVAAGRRLLVVLDNARNPGQVRPLLPGSPGCLVLVTSRASLAGLAVSESADRLTLDVLSVDEARQLLAARLGSERVSAEPGAVDELIRLCGRLPLALAIAAARAAGHPGFPLAGLAAELRDETGRLDALEAGDPGSDIRAVFSWSYRGLSEPAARMFRALGAHPGPDVSAAAAASAGGIPLPAARRCVRELVQAHLLAEHLPCRFGFHDLLRAYAAEQASADGDGQAVLELKHRALDHYLHTAYRAAMLIQPQRDPLTLTGPQPGVVPEALADAAQAQAWLQAEYRVLLGAVTPAVEAGFDVHAWQIPWTLAGFLDWRGHWHEAARIQRIALDATVRLGSVADQAVACRLLATTCGRLGDYEEAQAHLQNCVRLSRQLADPICEARARQNLAWVAERQGRYADSRDQLVRVCELFAAAGDRSGEASARGAIGLCLLLLGDYEAARSLCREALVLLRELGMRHGEAHAWDNIGHAEHQLGRHAEAADCYQRALSIFRELGHRYYEADVLSRVGDTCHAAGDPRAAREAWQRAVEIFDDLQHPDADRVRVKLG
jgi:tetratricopeptide (TPR) repeat protein/transcriptional regulator with XRE-family HTH domain